MPKYRRTDDRTLINLDRFIQQKKKEVTQCPVYTRISGRVNPQLGDVRLVKYTKPCEYEVVFHKQFYEQNRNNPRKLQQIAAHELAHIEHPVRQGQRHTNAFRERARQLGAGRYSRSRQG